MIWSHIEQTGSPNKETGIDGFPRRGCDLRRAPSFDGFDAEGHEVDMTSAIGLRVGENDDYNSEDEDDLTAASSGINAFDSDSHDLDKCNRRRRDKQFRFIVCVGLASLAPVCAGAAYLIVGNEDRDSSHSSHLPVENDAFSFDESGDDESNLTVTEKETSPMEAGDMSFPLSPAQVMGPNAIGAMDSTPTAPAESALAATVDSGLTSSAGGTLTTFYAIADCPYDDYERQNLMPAYIENLDGDADFMVHLGDLQSAKVDRCREYAYRKAARILGRSAVTTFVLPGDNDINDCDDVSHGESMWLEHLHRFDERWDHPFDVRRWGSLDESFTFVHRRVLYFAVNIVGGKPHSKTEKKRRHREHLAQIRGTLSEIGDGDFDVMVLLGHAEPSWYHNDFFWGSDGFYSIVAEVGKPTLHLHGDRHEYYEQPGSDELGLDNYMVISLDGKSIAPPIRVEIDVSRKSPITVSRVRKGLGVECCSRGWPPSDEL